MDKPTNEADVNSLMAEAVTGNKSYVPAHKNPVAAEDDCYWPMNCQHAGLDSGSDN